MSDHLLQTMGDEPSREHREKFTVVWTNAGDPGKVWVVSQIKDVADADAAVLALIIQGSNPLVIATFKGWPEQADQDEDWSDDDG